MAETSAVSRPGIEMIVPIEYCEPKSVTKHYIDQGYVVLGDREYEFAENERRPKLRAKYLLKPVFGNLNIGAISGLGNAKDGCPGKLVYDGDFLADLLAGCAHYQVSKLRRPSAKELVAIAEYMVLPTHYGREPCHLLLERLFDAIERRITPAAFPNAFLLINGAYFWADHTRAWAAANLTLEDMMEQTSTKARSKRQVCVTGKVGFGKTAICNAAITIFAKRDVFDVEACLLGHRRSNNTAAAPIVSPPKAGASVVAPPKVTVVQPLSPPSTPINPQGRVASSPPPSPAGTEQSASTLNGLSRVDSPLVRRLQQVNKQTNTAIGKLNTQVQTTNTNIKQVRKEHAAAIQTVNNRIQDVEDSVSKTSANVDTIGKRLNQTVPLFARAALYKDAPLEALLRRLVKEGIPSDAQ